MNITVNSACTSIHITSQLVDNFQANPANGLEVIFQDCEKNIFSYEVLAENIEEIDDVNTLVLTPELEIFDDSETFPDGVYAVKLLYTAGETQLIELSCMLVKCELECRVFDYQSENMTSNIFQYYQALLLGEDCDNCNCSGMCALYNKILDMLADTKLNDCGGCK